MKPSSGFIIECIGIAIGIIGSTIVGDLSKVLDTTQKSGFIIIIVGLVITGVGYGLIIAPKNKEVEPKTTS